MCFYHQFHETIYISSKIPFWVCWITKYDFTLSNHSEKKHTHTRNKSLQTTLKVFFKKADGFKVYADLMECQGESERGLSAWATITIHNPPKKISSTADDQRVTVAKRESEAQLLNHDTATVLSLILVTELLTQPPGKPTLDTQTKQQLKDE